MAFQNADELRCEALHPQGEAIALVRQALVDQETAGAIAETFKVLGDPTRVRILDALGRAELCVCDLATLLGSSESAVSHQLRLLRTLRLVRSRRSGRLVFYALDDQHITDLMRQTLLHVREPQTEPAPVA